MLFAANSIAEKIWELFANNFDFLWSFFGALSGIDINSLGVIDEFTQGN